MSLINEELMGFQISKTHLVELNGGSFPLSWFAVLIIVIEHELLVGRRWCSKGRGHDSVHLLHQVLLLSTDCRQDGVLG